MEPQGCGGGWRIAWGMFLYYYQGALFPIINQGDIFIFSKDVFVYYYQGILFPIIMQEGYFV